MLQIIELLLDLLSGKTIRMPPDYGAFKKAEKIKKTEGKQGKMEI